VPRISEASLAEHRQRTEAALLDAWGDLMRERGLESLTLAHVAKRAGVARNTVYGYFPDKHHLLLAYLEREVARFMERLTEAIDATAGAEARLRILIDEMLRCFAANRAAGHDLAAVVGPEAFADVMRRFDPVRKITHRVVREGIHEGVFRALDPDVAAELVGTTMGAFRVAVSQGRISPDEAAEQTLDFILRGLGVAPEQLHN
jgi:AcrR family transcriptional regulator